jgi:hypothetical protein
MAFIEEGGKVTHLQVRDVGFGFGPQGDQIQAEAILHLNNDTSRGRGFTLRTDGNRVAHQGMLDLLRNAFTYNSKVVLNSEVPDGKKNGITKVVLLTK